MDMRVRMDLKDDGHIKLYTDESRKMYQMVIACGNEHIELTFKSMEEAESAFEALKKCESMIS